MKHAIGGAVSAGAAGILALAHFWLNARQPAPYMDELFHVPQADEFCRAVRALQWPVYDANITTPPGIYAVAALLRFCGTQGLRALSSVWGLVALWGIVALLRGLRARSGGKGEVAEKESEIWGNAVLVWAQPVFLFYAFLFYTETAAVACLVWTWVLALKGRHGSAAIVGVVSTLMRQTNMVWHAFVAADSAVYLLAGSISSNSNVVQYISAIWSHVLRHLWPHIAAGACYVVFIVVNGGIAIGDKTRHAPVLHFAMFPYFLAFRALIAAPILLVRLRALLTAARAAANNPIWVRTFLASSAVIAAMVMASGARVHPFVLADNRHYTFYLYRWVLLRSSLIRFGLVPLYGASLIFPFVHIMHCARYRGQDTARWLFTELAVEVILHCCVIVSVIPSELLEPRYFVIGTLISVVRAMARHRNALSGAQTFLAGLSYLGANFAIIYIFAELPFERPPDPHMPHDRSPGRFMF